MSEASNKAEACVHHPESSFAREQLVKLAGEFTKAFVSSPCDQFWGTKSHPRILNVWSRAGAEISSGDLREGLEGFALAVREERIVEVTAPVPAPLGQAATAGGRFRHEGKLLPAEAG